MLLLTDEVKRWLIKEAKSFHSHECLMTLYCYAMRQDQEEHKRLLRMAHKEDLPESERSDYFNRAYAIPLDTQSFAFAGAGWGFDEIKKSKFRQIDLEGEEVFVPPELYSFLEGRELVVSECGHELVPKEPASDSEILEILEGDTGPFLTTALINDGESGPEE